ncbi:peptidase M16 inactive domain-containing protein [gut metagenome]|uniref:Peptidase M16 inactive domain-containing protein n=1 Tax=gut metagenome TaxID=749906 RepID=J9GIY0_9ZZZZ
MIDRTIQPAIRQPEHLAVQEPEIIILPNGVKMYVLNAGDNEVVRMDLLFGGGRWQQDCLLQALFTNRMLREGTVRYTAAEISEKLDYYGAWLDLSNASEHSYVSLYSLSKYLPQTLEVLESMIKEPVFPEKELHTVLENNIQQFKVNSSKVDFLSHRMLVSALYGALHPCGHLVNEADYHHITTELLQDFFRRFYHSHNCSIYLSGKITTDVLRRVEEVFGKEDFGEGREKVGKRFFQPQTSSEKRLFTERPDALQSAVRMGQITIARQHPDYLKLRVLNTILGGYFGSRLMSNIREEKGYTYGISSAIIPYPEHSLFMICTETANEYVEPLIREVYQEIDKLQNDVPDVEELTMVQNYMLGELCRTYESAFSLADAWMYVHVSGLTNAYFENTLNAVKSITPQEIRELAGKYLVKEQLKECVAGKVV